MADIIKLIKKQSKQRVAELRELSSKLSGQLKNLIHLIPETTRTYLKIKSCIIMHAFE